MQPVAIVAESVVEFIAGAGHVRGPDSGKSGLLVGTALGGSAMSINGSGKITLTREELLELLTQAAHTAGNIS